LQPDIRLLMGGGASLATGIGITAYSANPDGRPEFIAAGGIAMLIGTIAVTPALIRRGASRAASALGLSSRLAVRYAARHYIRTSSAVAAITTAIAGSVALTFVGAAETKTTATVQDIRREQVIIPRDAADLLGSEGLDRISTTLPTRATVVLEIVTGSDEGWISVPFSSTPDDVTSLTSVSAAEQRHIVVGRGDVVAAVTNRAIKQSELAILDAGGAVAFNDTLVINGRVTLATESGHQTALPAVVASQGEYFSKLPGLVVSPATANRMRLRTSTDDVLIDTSRTPKSTELAAARDILLRAQVDALKPPRSPILPKYTEKAGGSAPQTSTMFYILAAVSAIVTMAASFVAVGLAASEMRGDLSVMSAVGATPKVRRRIRALQAMLVSGVASPLGVIAGVGPAIGYVSYSARLTWHTPWLPLMGVVLIPPLLATAIGAVSGRAQLPAVRRAP
jgi:putative ABC transport system permease protein